MGCGDSRPNINPNEDRIQRFESNLGFHKTKSEEFDMYFFKFSTAFIISERQLKVAIEYLKLNTQDLSDHSSSLAILLSYFKKENDVYDKRELASLGILLGSGSDIEKQKILFLNYDIEISNTLDINEIKTMLADILAIVLVKLPRAAQEFIKDPDNDQAFKAYRKKLRNAKKSLYNYYENLFLKNSEDELTEDEFHHLFRKDEIKALIDTSKLREFAKDFPIENTR